jgi:hypothetical protein
MADWDAKLWNAKELPKARPDWNAKPPPKAVAPKGWQRSELARLIPAVLYPAHASEADRKELAERTAPGKKSPMQAMADRRGVSDKAKR